MKHFSHRNERKLGLTTGWILGLGLSVAVGTMPALLMGSAWAQQPVTKKPTVKVSSPITLNFQNAEIEAVARTIAALSGRNVVVDPRVKGTLTLVSDKPVSSTTAFNQFLTALRFQNFSVVESAGVYKIVPEADAKLQASEESVTIAGEATKVTGNQVVTQIFKLNFESANNLLPVLRPLIGPNNTINVNPGNNSLIITDYADNLLRMARIIAASDVANATDVEIIPLKHANATELAALVLRLVDASASGAAPGQPGGGEASRTSVVAEPRSNALIVRAPNGARLALVRNLIAKLDQPSSQGAMGNIHVVYLKNADATKLANTLRAALSASGSGAGAGSLASSPAAPALTNASPGANFAASSAANAGSTGGQIQADSATNSLIITASDPQMRQIRAVIDKLDARRSQVFVESLIAEVNANKAAQFGIQWQSALGSKGGNVGVLGTNFGTGGGNIFNLAAGAASGAAVPNPGFNFGYGHAINGVYVLGALANFLETTGDGNILSTPNLLTLDNEEAKIVIGQNVPFLTGQYTNSSAGSTSNPFQTIERKDVGITLRVKPQISENGTIKMTIFQEVSSVEASSINSPSGLVTNKRSIESNVLVEDGAVVVLGGLLQDQTSNNQQRVPGLGDIPFLGALFRNEARTRTKTNLMVFLRPVIVRDGASTQSMSIERYENMRSLQLEDPNAPGQNSSRINYGTPLLPSLKLDPEWRHKAADKP